MRPKINDVAHFGDDVESEVEEPLPQGATTRTALEKLTVAFHTEILPAFMAFIQNHPLEDSAYILKYKQLANILKEAVDRLAAIKIETNSDSWTRRNELATEFHDLLSRLNKYQKRACGHKDCGEILYREPDLRRHYEEIQ
jgi:hypothetical protein